MSSIGKQSTTFLIIRHAQSANNALAEHLRVADPGLTALGIQQASVLAIYLRAHPITKIYCSGFLRSIETAAPISKQFNLPVYVHSQLYEVKGCFSGYRADQLRPEPGLGRSAILARYADWEIDAAIDDRGWNFGRSIESNQEADKRAASIADWMQRLHERSTIESQCVAMVIHADFKVKLLNALVNIGAFAMQSEMPWNETDPYNTSITNVMFRNTLNAESSRVANRTASHRSNENRTEAKHSDGEPLFCEIGQYNTVNHLHSDLISS